MNDANLENHSLPALPKIESQRESQALSSLNDGQERNSIDGSDPIAKLPIPNLNEDWMSVMSDRVAKFDQTFRKFVSDNPIPVYLIAFGAGVGIGVLVNRKTALEGAQHHDAI